MVDMNVEGKLSSGLTGEKGEKGRKTCPQYNIYL